MSRGQVSHVVDHARPFFVRPAAPPDRPDEALLFLGDDEAGVPLDPCDAHARQLPGPVGGGDQVAAVSRPTNTEPTTTKAGTPHDPDYEQRLADEAEAGFDPATLTRRHAGRPSLSGRAGHSKRVDLRVDDQTYEAIQRIADQDHRRVSDVVRDAINRYLEAG